MRWLQRKVDKIGSLVCVTVFVWEEGKGYETWRGNTKKTVYEGARTLGSPLQSLLLPWVRQRAFLCLSNGMCSKLRGMRNCSKVGECVVRF